MILQKCLAITMHQKGIPRYWNAMVQEHPEWFSLRNKTLKTLRRDLYRTNRRRQSISFSIN